MRMTDPRLGVSLASRRFTSLLYCGSTSGADKADNSMIILNVATTFKFIHINKNAHHFIGTCSTPWNMGPRVWARIAVGNSNRLFHSVARKLHTERCWVGRWTGAAEELLIYDPRRNALQRLTRVWRVGEKNHCVCHALFPTVLKHGVVRHVVRR